MDEGEWSDCVGREVAMGVVIDDFAMAESNADRQEEVKQMVRLPDGMAKPTWRRLGRTELLNDILIEVLL